MHLIEQWMVLLDDRGFLLLAVLSFEFVLVHRQQVHHSSEVLALAQLCLEDDGIHLQQAFDGLGCPYNRGAYSVHFVDEAQLRNVLLGR